MKLELRKLLKKAGNEIPPRKDAAGLVNNYRTVKKSYRRGGILEVIKTVDHFKKSA